MLMYITNHTNITLMEKCGFDFSQVANKTQIKYLVPINHTSTEELFPVTSSLVVSNYQYSLAL